MADAAAGAGHGVPTDARTLPGTGAVFDSFILWLGPFPLPGAWSVLALLAVGLVLQLQRYIPLRAAASGTLLIHISALVLLVGGIISSYGREQGYIVLAEKDKARLVTDYHTRILQVSQHKEVIWSSPFDALSEGQTIVFPDMQMKLLSLCRNCTPEPAANSEGRQGSAQAVRLNPAGLRSQDEENKAGVMFALSGAGKADGIYIAGQSLNAPARIAPGGDIYEVDVALATRSLPFTLTLLSFDKIDYPGTDNPRAFQSRVQVNDERGIFDALIEMNQPLRYRGYTLYQSSWLEESGKLYSVLAVVKDTGQLFPYLSIIMLCIGFTIHAVVQLTAARRQSSRDDSCASI